jgi:hypothetical protein
MTELREQLFEAHVRHELARWRGELLPARVEVLTRELFRWMQTVTLREVSSSEQIAGIIQRCAIELRVSGGIMELVGEMTQLVVNSPLGDDTRLDELLGDTSYELFADKVTRLSAVWRELTGRIVHTEAAELVQAELIAHALHEALRLDAAPAAVRGLVAGLEARIARTFARLLRAALARSRGEHTLDPELVRSVADEVWTSLAPLRLRELFTLVGEQDLEDFVVLVHQFWLEYRKSPYFQRIMREMVDYFFTKYGEQTLAELVEDMGVGEQLVANELAALFGPLVEHALHSGVVEAQIRAQLRPFYDSKACADLLSPRESAGGDR